MLDIQKLTQTIADKCKNIKDIESVAGTPRLKEYLAGTVKPQLPTIYRIAKALDVDPTDIMINVKVEHHYNKALNAFSTILDELMSDMDISAADKIAVLGDAVSKMYGKPTVVKDDNGADYELPV